MDFLISDLLHIISNIGHLNQESGFHVQQRVHQWVYFVVDSSYQMGNYPIQYSNDR